MTTEDLHVLVVERCHPPGECPRGTGDACWDPEWEVLHPPTCHHPLELGDEHQPGPDYRCGLDYDVQMRGDDAFDLVDQHPPVVAEPYGIADLLPAGRYLCRWYVEEPPRPWSDDYRSGIELVEGPAWATDREGWDRMPADPAAASNYADDDALVLVDVDDPDVIRRYKAMSEEGTA